MDKFISLKKNSDFGEVYRSGRSYGNKLLVMYVLEKGQDHKGRLGISVSKKVGNSVVRHRIKRLIREVFRLHISEWRDGCDIVVVARREAKEKSFSEIEKALLHLEKKMNIRISQGEME